MKKFYLYNGSVQQGPFTLNQLKRANINNDTPIWHEGLTDWIKAEETEELREFFKSSTPPPFNKHIESPPSFVSPAAQNKNPNTVSVWKVIRVLLIVGVIGFVTILLINNREDALMKVTVNPPNPKVLTTRSETDPASTLLDYKQAVHATIINQGGSGKILVTATIHQGSKRFEEKKEIYLSENQSQEVYLMFDGPKALGGRITYDVTARSIE